MLSFDSTEKTNLFLDLCVYEICYLLWYEEDTLEVYSGMLGTLCIFSVMSLQHK